MFVDKCQFTLKTDGNNEHFTWGPHAFVVVFRPKLAKYLQAEKTSITKFTSKVKYTLYVLYISLSPVNTAILEVTEPNSVKTPKCLGYK